MGGPRVLKTKRSRGIWLFLPGGEEGGVVGGGAVYRFPRFPNRPSCVYVGVQWQGKGKCAEEKTLHTRCDLMYAVVRAVRHDPLDIPGSVRLDHLEGELVSCRRHGFWAGWLETGMLGFEVLGRSVVTSVPGEVGFYRAEEGEGNNNTE